MDRPSWDAASAKWLSELALAASASAACDQKAAKGSVGLWRRMLG